MHRRTKKRDVISDNFVIDDTDSVATDDTFAPHTGDPALNSIRQTDVKRTHDNVSRSRMQSILSTSETDEDTALDMDAPSSADSGSESGNHTTTERPVREAAANAGLPIRKHARLDLGYVTDLADTYDSDDEDELDAEGTDFAPFETQEETGHTLCQIPACEDIGALGESQTAGGYRFAEAARHIKADGIFKVIEEARLAEHASGSKLGAFYHDRPEFWAEMSFLTLCSMPEKVIYELICGNLKHAYDTDDELRHTLDMFEKQAKRHPCIYARSLTTAEGDLMSTDQARRLVKWLQRYISDDITIREHERCQEAFRRIDAEFGTQKRVVHPEADRAYLASRSNARLTCRVDNVRLFCQKLIAECDRCEANDVPLKPLIYIGYAARADRRKRQHEACGASANWLATLAQALCNVLWGRGSFKMHFMVICLLAEKRQGVVAEMLLTRITVAYYNTGGGFCIDVAGKSMESLHFKQLTTIENQDMWNDYNEWVQKSTPLNANAREQQARYQSWCARQAAAQEDRDTTKNLAPDEIVRQARETKEFVDKVRDSPAWSTAEKVALAREVDSMWEETCRAYSQYITK